MAVEELLLYFLVIPAATYAAATALIRLGMRRGAEQHLGLLRERGTLSRFLVFTTIQTVPILYGLVLYIQLRGAPSQPLVEDVARSFAQTWAAATILTGLSQAWIVLHRGAAAFEGETFARVLVLSVVPHTVVVFALVIGIQIVVALSDPVTPAIAEGLTRASFYMMIGAVAAPIEAVLFNLSKDLRGPALGRALIRGVAAEPIVVIALVLAMQELARVL